MSETASQKKMLLTCPGCQKRFQVTGDKLLGRRATCKSCGAGFIVDGGCISEVSDDVVLPLKQEDALPTDVADPLAMALMNVEAPERKAKVKRSSKALAEIRELLRTVNLQALVPILFPFSITVMSVFFGTVIIQHVLLREPAHGISFMVVMGFGLAMCFVLPFVYWGNTRTKQHIGGSILFSMAILFLNVWLGSYEVVQRGADGINDVVIHSRWDGRPLYRPVGRGPLGNNNDIGNIGRGNELRPLVESDEPAPDKIELKDLDAKTVEIFAALDKGQKTNNERDRAAAFWPIVRNSSKLESTNNFYENPTVITTKLADDPYEWSHVIGIRDDVTKDQEPTLCYEVQGHLRSLVWFPLKTNMVFQREEYGQSGENDLIEWKTTHAINDGHQQYSIAFRLKR